MSPKEDKQKNNKNDEQEHKRLLTLFAENSQAFTDPDTIAKRNRLKLLLNSQTKGLNHQQLNQYAVELIHRCPNFLEERDGFEWIPRRYKAVLQGARMVPDSAKIYWDELLPAVKRNIRSSGMAQLPENRERDFLQAMLFHLLKNKGLTSTQAVDRIKGLYRERGLEKDDKEIYRAVQRVSLQVAGTWTDLLSDRNRQRAEKLFGIMEEMNRGPEDLDPPELSFLRRLSRGFRRKKGKRGKSGRDRG